METLAAEIFALEFSVQGRLLKTFSTYSEKHKFFGVAITGKACSPKVLGEIRCATFKNRQNIDRDSIVGFSHSEKHKFFGVDGASSFVDPCNKQKSKFFATRLKKGAQ